jgi:hypothetical protein
MEDGLTPKTGGKRVKRILRPSQLSTFRNVDGGSRGCRMVCLRGRRPSFT